MPGARRKAPGERKKPTKPKTLTSNARAKGTGIRLRVKDSRLIPVEERRPLTAGLRTARRKKCPDCHYCQGCSQDRCRLCRAGRKPRQVKLSQAEQIALFEKINHPKRRKPSGLGRR
jgi:hypothetical protein